MFPLAVVPMRRLLSRPIIWGAAVLALVVIAGGSFMYLTGRSQQIERSPADLERRPGC